MQSHHSEFKSNIRDMVVGDLQMVFDWRNHPAVRRYMFNARELNFSEHEAWYYNNVDNPRKRLLIYEESKTAMGFMAFDEPTESLITEWGFYLSPKATVGAGRRMGRLSLTFAFDKMNAYKVCAKVLAFNDRSIRFHDALGFSEEGVLRKQHFDSGQYYDVFCYGLFKDEWLELR